MLFAHADVKKALLFVILGALFFSGVTVLYWKADDPGVRCDMMDYYLNGIMKKTGSTTWSNHGGSVDISEAPASVRVRAWLRWMRSHTGREFRSRNFTDRYEVGDGSMTLGLTLIILDEQVYCVLLKTAPDSIGLAQRWKVALNERLPALRCEMVERPAAPPGETNGFPENL